MMKNLINTVKLLYLNSLQDYCTIYMSKKFCIIIQRNNNHYIRNENLRIF